MLLLDIGTLFIGQNVDKECVDVQQQHVRFIYIKTLDIEEDHLGTGAIGPYNRFGKHVY